MMPYNAWHHVRKWNVVIHVKFAAGSEVFLLGAKKPTSFYFRLLDILEKYVIVLFNLFCKFDLSSRTHEKSATSLLNF